MTKQQLIRRITECIEYHLNEISTETVANVLANSDREEQIDRVYSKLCQQINDKYSFEYDKIQYSVKQVYNTPELYIHIMDCNGINNVFAGVIKADGVIVPSGSYARNIEYTIRNLPAGPRKKLQAMISEITKFKENYKKTNK